MAKMREVPGSLLALLGNALKLYRPVMGTREPAQFERLRCECGCVAFEVDRTTDGWCVECPECGEASMLAPLINGDWQPAKSG